MKNSTHPRRKAVFVASLFAAAFLLSAFRAQAQANANPPNFLTYQGFLVDANGVALGTNAPKNYDVIFRIWDAASGGTTPLWAEQQTVTVDKGYFSVLLGEGGSIGEPRPGLSTLFTNNTASDRWVGITVKGIGAGGADASILPRLRLLTSPYSFLAQRAINAATVDGSGLVSGTVPDARLSGNVALRSGGNTFSGTQIVNGNATVNGAFTAANSSGSLNYYGFGGSGTVLLAGLRGLNNNGPQFRFEGAGSGFVDMGQNSVGDFVLEQSDAARLTITPSGNVGIGTTTPGFPLNFPNSHGDKISLWGQSGNSFGFGIQGSLLQIHADVFGSDIAFGYGSSASMVERMRIKGNGNVGIGTASPGATLDVNGSLRASSSVTVGSGANTVVIRAPLVYEEQTSNNQTTWNPKVINISSYADRPGGFKLRIYAQHELSFEVRNFEATIVVQKAGYANDPDFPTRYKRISLNMGPHGRHSMILGYMDANGCNCTYGQEVYPDGWVKITNYQVNSAGVCGTGGFCIGRDSICVTFHPHVSGQIVISDN